VLSQPPTVPILEARLVESHRSAATKPEFRVSFLNQIAALAGKAKETLTAQQLRYKRAFDAHVRVKNANIASRDLVFVRTYADAVGSPKLLIPASGPYIVANLAERTISIKTPSGLISVNSDRETKAPQPGRSSSECPI
jgi:hypothetical protein